MKKYKEFMNGVKAPDTLHQRLMELETPTKGPIPWKRYGCIAAALVLVCGLGGLAVWAEQINSRTGPIPFYPTGYQMTNPEIVEESEPDIAPVDPGDVPEPGEKTLGGYEVRSGSGPEAMVSYYVLPYIEYGDASGTMVCIDWDIPQGAVRRELTQEEIVALMGGEDAVITHLDWGSYELSGWGAWYEDGSFWGAYIDGQLLYAGGPASQFQFAVTAGELPPTCFGFPESVTQEVRGLTVTADKADLESELLDRSCWIYERRVSFMKDGYGYRFEMSCGGTGEAAEKLVSRLVRQVADKGLALHTVDPTVKTYTCAFCGNTFPEGTEHNDPAISICPICGGDPATHTCPYDPSGEADEPYVCSGYPVPEPEETDVPEFVPDYDPTYEDGVPDAGPEETDICPICGAVLPENAAEHSHEVCGYPLAPEMESEPTGDGPSCEDTVYE